MFGTYGPNVRNLMTFISDDRQRNLHEDAIRRAASRIAHNMHATCFSLQELDFSTGSDDSDEVLSSVIFVKPASRDDDLGRGQPALYIPTKYLAQELAAHLVAADDASQHRFFAWMSGHPSSRPAAGWIFENYMHAYLTSPTSSAVALDGTLSIPIVSNIAAGTLVGLRASEPPFYWRPSSVNPDFPGIDAVVHTGTDVWVLQATTGIGSTRRTPAEGLQKLAEEISAGPSPSPSTQSNIPESTESSMRFVVVGPDMQAARSVVEQLRDTDTLASASGTGRLKGMRIRMHACALPLVASQQRTAMLKFMQEVYVYILLWYPFHGMILPLTNFWVRISNLAALLAPSWIPTSRWKNEH